MIAVPVKMCRHKMYRHKMCRADIRYAGPVPVAWAKHKRSHGVQRTYAPPPMLHHPIMQRLSMPQHAPARLSTPPCPHHALSLSYCLPYPPRAITCRDGFPQTWIGCQVVTADSAAFEKNIDASSLSSKERKTSGGKPTCRHYFSEKGCHRGEKCRFSHSQ